MGLQETRRLTRDEVHAALLERPATARELVERLRPWVSDPRPVVVRAARLCRELRRRGEARLHQVLQPSGEVRWAATRRSARGDRRTAAGRAAVERLRAVVSGLLCAEWPAPRRAFA